MSAPTITPGHIQRAKDALLAAGTLEAAGSQALDLATVFYNETPQVSHTDALRRERNLIQEELETVSSQLQQERQKSHRLEQALVTALAEPKFHQNKAYKLRKRLRAILVVLEHPQAKEATKLKNVIKLVVAALAGSDEDLG
ncbi:hypothetical protein E4631_25045 [Hymenobacter sp. UV11]|uniref:hypothetical protein n=1 Tax=Hymenobacter sp. UV11 TaxID=1849735 RepID=UPI0010604D2D|nr:hypothetical protein [Hymenobacter sp. UV11]TDN38077.1 hypothetical protein A8B98_00485 [Hymenobacter sp. UV11]TFZ62480.1 hypothetical protein E4631_25045 [Hymenobacter sp. UV11]